MHPGFLREDLTPALERRGVLVIYVDLWTERSADPVTVIAGAIRGALVGRAGDGTGLLERLGRRLGVESVPVAGVAISTTNSNTSNAGANALFALKAARDELDSAAPATGCA